jgi:hypothetical protein
MKILVFLSPLFFTLAALFLSAIEASLFPHLGLPAFLNPDLNLVLIVFLTSCYPGLRSLLAAIGVALAASLFSSSPGFPVAFGHIMIFLIGSRLNQTVFMNHILPQALFAGGSRFLLQAIAVLLVSVPENFFFRAFGGALTTAVFALPLLALLNALRERYLPQAANLISA